MDLGASDGLEVGLSHLVGDLLRRELTLGPADGADLRDRVNARRRLLYQRPVALALRDVDADESPLVLAGAGQRRWTDQVARVACAPVRPQDCVGLEPLAGAAVARL